MYEHILVAAEGRVGTVTLDRPKALNALSGPLLAEVERAIADFDADPAIGCILLTGSDRAFAAGADIAEMQPLTYPGTYVDDQGIVPW